MKAQELRIGNYVSPPVGCEPHIGEITAINLDGYDCELIDDNYEEYVSISQFGKIRDLDPITLTEEWLLKFGFEKKESSSCIVYHIGMNEVTHDWLFDLTWLRRPELINAPNVPFYKNGRHSIYYVHQLQNLYFALTGDELTMGGNK
jgi:hypothetical protein